MSFSSIMQTIFLIFVCVLTFSYFVLCILLFLQLQFSSKLVIWCISVTIVPMVSSCNICSFVSVEMRKEKSLGIMSQKFLMLFLISEVNIMWGFKEHNKFLVGCLLLWHIDQLKELLWFHLVLVIRITLSIILNKFPCQFYSTPPCEYLTFLLQY